MYALSSYLPLNIDLQVSSSSKRLYFVYFFNKHACSSSLLFGINKKIMLEKILFSAVQIRVQNDKNQKIITSISSGEICKSDNKGKVSVFPLLDRKMECRCFIGVENGFSCSLVKFDPLQQNVEYKGCI